MSDNTTVRPRIVRHVSIDSGQPCAAFRAAVLSDATAGNGLVNVFTFDPSPLMKLNGNTRSGVTYLTANVVRAAR